MMTDAKSLLLAGMALAALSAHADSYAPAEERPGRTVLVPMSVERPPGEGWALVRRTDVDLVFLRPAEKNRSSLVAIASGKVPDKRARSTQELAANIREELKAKADDTRFEVLSEEVRPDPATDRKCVRYRQNARDRGAKGSDGQAQVIALHGLACLHPADEGIVLAITLSERGPAESANPALADDAERFFSGLRPHRPLAGNGWRAPAEQGDVNAQVMLARHLFQSNELEEAIVWLGRAADKGHLDAHALLGLSYLTGRAVTRSPEEALRWLRPAADKGYPKAEGLLALALISAPQVRNDEEGRRWARKAAGDGDPLGQALLGELLLFGKSGMEKNEAEGSAWVRKAAEQGDAKAQYLLASMLAKGFGLAQDPAQSRFWLELAASQGHADARKIVEQSKRPASAAPTKTPSENK